MILHRHNIPIQYNINIYIVLLNTRNHTEELFYITFKISNNRDTSNKICPTYESRFILAVHIINDYISSQYMWIIVWKLSIIYNITIHHMALESLNWVQL